MHYGLPTMRKQYHLLAGVISVTLNGSIYITNKTCFTLSFFYDGGYVGRYNTVMGQAAMVTI